MKFFFHTEGHKFNDLNIEEIFVVSWTDVLWLMWADVGFDQISSTMRFPTNNIHSSKFYNFAYTFP